MGSLNPCCGLKKPFPGYSVGYHLVIEHSHGKSPFIVGKPSINGPFSMAILNNQRVNLEPIFTSNMS